MNKLRRDFYEILECCGSHCGCIDYLRFNMNRNMKINRKTIFNLVLILFSASLYLLNNLFFKKISTGILYYFFTGYFNDLLCPLFFVSYANIMLNFIQKEIAKLQHILLFCFIAGLFWEFIAPLMKKTSVTDFFDLLCYCIGGFLYWVISIVLYSNAKK